MKECKSCINPLEEADKSSLGIKTTGTPSMSELSLSPGFPSDDRVRKGPVAIIECVEKIPCNPCETACSVHHSITIGKNITDLPVLNEVTCTGCGLCIAACPGLAIYVKDYTFEEERVSILFPYEYLHLPEKKQIVQMTDRFGNIICEGEVLSLNNSRRNNHTVLIKAAFDKVYFTEVVSMNRLSRE